MSGRHIRHGWTGALLSDVETFNEIICFVNRFPHRRQIFVCHGESVTGETAAILSPNQESDSTEGPRVNGTICALQLSAPTIVAGCGISAKLIATWLLSDALGYPLYFLHRRTVSEISYMLAAELCRKSIKLLLIRDAQILPPPFMRALLSNRLSQLVAWPLSFVLIGTNELHNNLLECSDIHQQVTEWYSIEN
jgi:hypothetical protein